MYAPNKIYFDSKSLNQWKEQIEEIERGLKSKTSLFLRKQNFEHEVQGENEESFNNFCIQSRLFSHEFVLF